MVSFRAIVAAAVMLDGGVGGASSFGIKRRRPEDGTVFDGSSHGMSFPVIKRRSDEDGTFSGNDVH
jgi:hypothetical protein